MAKQKQQEKKAGNLQFQNVGLLVEDHALLKELAEREQRSMARQLSVLIREALAKKREAA